MKGAVRIFRKALGLLLLAMVLVNVANAGGRYLLHRAIPGSDEILVFAMVWLVFAGACLVSLEDKHLRFGLFAERLQPQWRRAYQRLCSGLTALLFGFLSYQSWQVMVTLGRVGQKSMASEIPMIVPHAAVPLSLAAMALISLYHLWKPDEPPPS